MLDHEQEAWNAGLRTVAGVDEAGRGPWAGPVVAAAVCFQVDFVLREQGLRLSGLTDSKKLTARRRDHFYGLLTGTPAIAIGVGVVDVDEIDRINILRATHKAMNQALSALGARVDLALVDGRPVPGLPCASRAVVKGDSLSLSIAAASVIAKVTRDRLMLELDRRYPQYGFARHKGYGTKDHQNALRTYGPSPCHRRSFEPVRNSLPTSTINH